MATPLQGGSTDPQVPAVLGKHSANGIGISASSAQGIALQAEADSNAALVASSKSGSGIDARSKTNTALVATSEQGTGIYARGYGNAGLFEGNVEVVGNLTCVNPANGQQTIILDGSAGDVILPNADCAEDFEVSPGTSCEPGTVMTLNDGGQLQEASTPYDRRVAGVVSGAGNLKPGIVLGRQQGATHGLPIALVGRVFCKVDAGYRPVAVGDLLTTSSTPGHAMKADDPARAFGAVIGKALKPVTQGTALIPILIALH
jgi:hypothetical protein